MGLFDPINKALQGIPVDPTGGSGAVSGAAIPQRQVDSAYWQQNGGVAGPDGFYGPPPAANDLIDQLHPKGGDNGS